jgi:hypothetical protein
MKDKSKNSSEYKGKQQQKTNQNQTKTKETDNVEKPMYEDQNNSLFVWVSYYVKFLPWFSILKQLLHYSFKCNPKSWF